MVFKVPVAEGGAGKKLVGVGGGGVGGGAVVVYRWRPPIEARCSAPPRKFLL